MQTAAPASDKPFATALPIPWLPAFTKATLPVRSIRIMNHTALFYPIVQALYNVAYLYMGLDMYIYKEREIVRIVKKQRVLPAASQMFLFFKIRFTCILIRFVDNINKLSNLSYDLTMQTSRPVSIMLL